MASIIPLVSEPMEAPAQPSPKLLKPLPQLSPTLTHDTRPETPRRATAPEPSSGPSPFTCLATTTLPLRPRTRSPYARGHSRSRSSGSSLLAPQMTRAYSSPVTDSSGHIPVPRPVSPFGMSSRPRSPMRKASEESFSSFGSQLDIDQTISEHSELDLTPRGTLDFDSMSTSPSMSNHNTFPRSRRRPASPLSNLTPLPFTPRSPLRSSTSTPSLVTSHYNESYPLSHSLSNSSISSTPSSLRSRSPSISSLETIPDSPDAELEAENIARLRAAADKEEQNEERVGRSTVRGGGDHGGGRMGRDNRKRWSVCGAERRGDLDLETIWED